MRWLSASALPDCARPRPAAPLPSSARPSLPTALGSPTSPPPHTNNLSSTPHLRRGLPAVQEFIDKHAEGFGERVTVKRIPGRSATLKFRNKEGGEREDVRVDAWKTEHLLQFLEKKLKAVKARRRHRRRPRPRAAAPNQVPRRRLSRPESPHDDAFAVAPPALCAGRGGSGRDSVEEEAVMAVLRLTAGAAAVTAGRAGGRSGCSRGAFWLQAWRRPRAVIISACA